MKKKKIIILKCEHRKIQTCHLKSCCCSGYREENDRGILMDHTDFSMDLPQLYTIITEAQ